MNVRARVHLIADTDRRLLTACGRSAETLHTDTLAAVTCWHCKHSLQARELREGGATQAC